MTATQKDPVLVVVQLTGGNDYLNTVIPYNNGLYRDNRKAVSIGDNQIIHLDGTYGFPSFLAPVKQFWDEGKLAIMHGVGYLDSPRSHFRSMDIWHTCEPDKVGTEGWLGRVAREYDPKKENVVTVVSFGPSLFRALAVPGVPVACVAGPLEKYGFLPTIQEKQERMNVLSRFARMYSPVVGSSVMEYLGTTGLDGLKGADILKVAPQRYASTVKYPNTPIARKLQGIAQVHLADLGTRIFYCDHGPFDTHAGQNPAHGALWSAVCEGLEAFMAALREHDHADNVTILLFSEFGRRVHDNGSGTDHGAAGPALLVRDPVKGGHYGEDPSPKGGKPGSGGPNPPVGFPGHSSPHFEK